MVKKHILGFFVKPKSIGIISGAGPLAGVCLLEQIFCLARELYGCWRDEDFPKVMFVSFPFSDMLSEEMDVPQIQGELRECLKKLRDDGASVIGIACNTLHAFLGKDEGHHSDLLQLPQLAAEAIPLSAVPLVLGTSTSMRFGLYRRRFPCIYPDEDAQTEADRIITQILKGDEPDRVVQELRSLIQEQDADVILLGCTELSLYKDELLTCEKTIIDPLNLMARQLITKSFGG
jgi:aspartate racemase